MLQGDFVIIRKIKLPQIKTIYVLILSSLKLTIKHYEFHMI